MPLVNAAYRGEGGWTTESHLVEGARVVEPELLETMADPAARFELAFSDERLVASVLLCREPGATCYLGMLSVAPRLQAAGIGRALLERAETLARGWGCRRVRIRVLETREELLAFYERRGYARTGRTEGFPVMEREKLKVPGLRFAEMEKAL